MLMSQFYYIFIFNLRRNVNPGNKADIVTLYYEIGVLCNDSFQWIINAMANVHQSDPDSPQRVTHEKQIATTGDGK